MRCLGVGPGSKVSARAVLKGELGGEPLSGEGQTAHEVLALASRKASSSTVRATIQRRVRLRLLWVGACKEPL